LAKEALRRRGLEAALVYHHVEQLSAGAELHDEEAHLAFDLALVQFDNVRVPQLLEDLHLAVGLASLAYFHRHRCPGRSVKPLENSPRRSLPEELLE